MRPEAFTLSGFVVLVVGFILAGIGAGVYAQQILCSTNFGGCNRSLAESALGTISMFLLLLFGTLLIIVGAVFATGGHISQHLRPVVEGDAASGPPLRVCVKCGRQVDQSASFCPSCGNPLAK